MATQKYGMLCTALLSFAGGIDARVKKRTGSKLSNRVLERDGALKPGVSGGKDERFRYCDNLEIIVT